MRITPGNSWSWAYQDVGGVKYLGLYIILDNGVRYFFKTCFTLQMLRQIPNFGEPFCIRDGQLLSDFMDGLNAVGVYDNSQGFDISLHVELAFDAVACARFVAAPGRVVQNFFITKQGEPLRYIKRGTVISLYTKDITALDFIVLDSENDVHDDVFRVMFINTEYHLGSNHMSVGAVIRVPRRVIFPFRALRQTTSTISYA